MADNIKGKELDVVKGSDANGLFVQSENPGNRIAVIARKSWNNSEVNDEENIKNDLECTIRPAFYVGKDAIGDAYLTEEDEDSTTDAIGGFPSGLTPRNIMQQYGGSISKVLDAILFPDVESQVVQPTITMNWSGSTTSKTVTIATGSKTYTFNPSSNFSCLSTTGTCTWASNTENGIPQASLPLINWSTTKTFYSGTTNKFEDASKISGNFTFTITSTNGEASTIYFWHTRKYNAINEVYKRNKKGTISEQAEVNLPQYAGPCTLTIFCPSVVAAMPTTAISGSVPTLAEAVAYLNSNGTTQNYQVWSGEASGTTYTEKNSKYIKTTVPDSDSNYFRIFAVPSAYTVQSYVQSDNINNYSNTYKLMGQSVLSKGTLDVVYNIYYKTSADSSSAVIINAYYK